MRRGLLSRSVPPFCCARPARPAAATDARMPAPIARPTTQTDARRSMVPPFHRDAKRNAGTGKGQERGAPGLTHTSPNAATTPPGAGPTLIRRVFPLRGSIRETVPSRLFATQTAPAPTATPLGPRPTGKVSAVETACGSIFASVRPELDVNQAASAPSATEAVSPEA